MWKKKHILAIPNWRSLCSSKWDDGRGEDGRLTFLWDFPTFPVGFKSRRAESQSVVKYSCSAAERGVVLGEEEWHQRRHYCTSVYTLTCSAERTLHWHCQYYLCKMCVCASSGVRQAGVRIPHNHCRSQKIFQLPERGGDLCQLETLETFNYSSCKIAVSTS